MIRLSREEKTPNLILDDKFFFKGDDTTIAPWHNVHSTHLNLCKMI